MPQTSSAGAVAPRATAPTPGKSPEGWAYIYGSVANPAATWDAAPAGSGPLPRWWTWAAGAFRESLAAVAAGSLDVPLLVDHDTGRALAGTRDGSLSVWAVRHGLRWRLNAGTRRGAAAVAWLKAHPGFRAVSIGGTADRFRTFTACGSTFAEVRAFALGELSLVRVPGFKGGYFTASARVSHRTGGATVPPSTDHQTLRALRAIEAAERGRLQAVHVPPEVFAAAVAAGLLARAKRNGYKLTAAGRARLTATAAGTGGIGAAGSPGRPSMLRT